MNDRKIELIALDLDGTLLRADKTISPANRDAIHRAVDAGIHIVLASGRMHSSTAAYANLLDFAESSYVISFNGAIARQLGGATLFEKPVDSGLSIELVEFCRSSGHHLNYYLDDTLYTAKNDRWVDVYYSRTSNLAEIAGDLSKFNGKNPTKLIIIDEPAAILELQPAMLSRFGARSTIMITDDEYLEFMSPEAGKGEALAVVAKALGIDRESCVAMGDNNNDLSMLLWVGRGIAMANSRPDVLKQVAEHAPPAEDDGVAVIINRILDGR